MSWTYLSQQVIIYGGSICLFGGILGNSLNIYIFSSDRNYRRTPCTFYFLIASIANLIYMSFNFTTRIAGAIAGVDLSSVSLGWCRTRQFFIFWFSLITFTCSCLAAIDQYLITSRNASLRQCSKIEWAHRIVMLVVTVWCLHAIPCLLFYNIVPSTNKCTNTNAAYAVYVQIYLLGLLCVAPITITSVFGGLTYRNIRQTRILAELNADRQSTRMTLFQVVFIMICLMPYSITTTYSLITQKMEKDANQLQKENFVTIVVTVITYLYYSGSCYVFCWHRVTFDRKSKIDYAGGKDEIGL